MHQKLSRRHMEYCTNLFVYPILDYGDTLYDSCNQSDKNKLRDVQLAAARAILGAKKGTSHERIYTELGWKPLQQRRNIHKLCRIYIIKGYTPEYLNHNLPRRLAGRGTRSTAAENYALYHCKTETFRNSFFPTAIKLYNELDSESKLVLSRTAFKSKTKRSLKLPVPRQYYTGPRSLNIILCQMRLGFSDLNSDLNSKGCIDSPLCSCGHGIENPQHYFFNCTKYLIQRDALLVVLNNVGVEYAADVLIRGCNQISEEANTELYNAALKYISDSNRFVK